MVDVMSKILYCMCGDHPISEIKYEEIKNGYSDYRCVECGEILKFKRYYPKPKKAKSKSIFSKIEAKKLAELLRKSK